MNTLVSELLPTKPLIIINMNIIGLSGAHDDRPPIKSKASLGRSCPRTEVV